jgi:hypothetical protein
VDLNNWLHATALSQFMLGWKWSWAIAETLHYIGMSFMVGAVLLMDARLMGFFRNTISLHQIHTLTPWALAAFLLNVMTGIAFLSTRFDEYMNNPSFEFKLGCLSLAGLNFLLFWFFVRGRLLTLPDDGETGVLAKSVGFSSILLWGLVIWGGRLIPVYGSG